MIYQPNLSGMFPPATPDSALETERNQSDQLESERICKSWSGSTWIHAWVRADPGRLFEPSRTEPPWIDADFRRFTQIRGGQLSAPDTASNLNGVLHICSVINIYIFTGMREQTDNSQNCAICNTYNYRFAVSLLSYTARAQDLIKHGLSLLHCCDCQV